VFTHFQHASPGPTVPATLDRVRMEQALALAELGFGQTEPNPRVGCVLGFDDGRVIGEGTTQRAGGLHAEAAALAAAHAAGHDTRGATAWVTLEPCAHHGRTPPCCDALVAAGIARVVVAVGDPFPAVAGEGVRRLRAAGVVVDLAGFGRPDLVELADLAERAYSINVGFFSRVTRGRPWVRVKAAITLDGRTALPDGRSQWITGAEARRDGHAWRRRASAVLTGVGTVLADDPRLDVRLVPTAMQPLRVVVDSALRTPWQARLFEAEGPLVFATATTDAATLARWRNRGAVVWPLPGAHGRVDLAGLLSTLAQNGVNEVHVEAGARLNAALVEADLVDEWLVYLAPMLLGTGLGMADMAPPASLSAAWRLKLVEQVRLGDDLRLRLTRSVGS